MGLQLKLQRVTSCRDHVLLAQTKVEFLTGGRGRNFRELTDANKNAQREEAYARAQWPSQESQQFCFLMLFGTGPALTNRGHVELGWNESTCPHQRCSFEKRVDNGHGPPILVETIASTACSLGGNE